MKIVIDYDDDAERKRLEPLNAGVFPLTIGDLAEFVICGTRSPGVPVVHRHGDPAILIRQTAMLTEDLRLAIMDRYWKAIACGCSDT